jgi:hypothetical protein
LYAFLAVDASVGPVEYLKRRRLLRGAERSKEVGLKEKAREKMRRVYPRHEKTLHAAV